MKITSIDTFIVDGGFRPWTFVKVETSEAGLIGWGDCTDWGSPGPVAATVARLADLVIGRDPMQVEAIWWDLAAASARHTGGLAWKAMSGIDSALWDIRGKALGAPVWQLLGGKLRDRLRLYWSHCGSVRRWHAGRLGVPKVETTDDLRRLSEEVLAHGFTAIKTNLFDLTDRPDARPLMSRMENHPGDAPPSAIRNAELIVGTFREALGPDVGIAPSGKARPGRIRFLFFDALPSSAPAANRRRATCCADRGRAEDGRPGPRVSWRACRPLFRRPLRRNHRGRARRLARQRPTLFADPERPVLCRSRAGSVANNPHT